MYQDNCSIDIMSAKDLSESIKGKNAKYIIEIPKYQRNLVWSSKQKNAFIDSLKRGFPVGTILLHKKSEKDGKIKYLIIDGLQRSSTINEYINDPTSFDLENDIIQTEVLNSINDILILLKKDKIKSEVKRIINVMLEYISSASVLGFTEYEGYSAYQCICFFNNYLNVKLDHERYQNPFIKLLGIIKKVAEITDIKVPVIIYNGKAEYLPEIFQRLNTAGTQLNKYQIYAAMWDQYKLHINNKEIIKIIENRYEEKEKQGYMIEGLKANKNREQEYNTFEYLFGFGKYILSYEKGKYQYLFRTEKEDEPESFIFILTAAIFGIEMRKMSELGKRFKNIVQDDFEKSIINSVKITSDILSPILQFGFNSKEKGKKAPIILSEAQIVSIIVYIYNKGQANLSNQKIVSEQGKNIINHFLFDTLDGSWDSATDTKLTETVTNNRYDNRITKEQWEATLTAYFENQLSKRHKDRTVLNRKDILLLTYIYSKKVSAADNLSKDTYDIDHIVPLKILKNKAQKNNEGLPMSAIGNLCLIRSTINNDKNELMFSEYLDTIQDRKIECEIKESIIIDLSKIPTRKNLSVDSYYCFLRERHELIKKEFIDEYVE